MQSSPTLSQKQRLSEAQRKFKKVILSSPEAIRRRYGAKPITLLKFIDPDMLFPRKLRTIFACLWLQQDLQGRPANRFIIKGPRGGGKSKMLGALGFVRWFLKQRNIVNLGGSLEQATGVYRYFTDFIFVCDAILEALPKEPTMLRTSTDKGNYYRAVAASQKQVRGPHPDDLNIDEACEAKDEIILSALPMIDTAENPLVVLTSTFHKIFGFFQETWDRADELGYTRLSWDIFDVTKSFDPAIWDDGKLNREIPDLADLRRRAAGRTGDPEGWVPVANIVQAWREKSSIDWFDVEYMGLRPSAEGMVNDPEDVDFCVSSYDEAEHAYVPGAETAGGLDWGFQGQTAWDVEMAHKDGVLVQLEMGIYTQVRSGVIIKDIVSDVLKYRIRTIHADGSHPFENADLRAEINKAIRELPEKEQFRCTLVEVPFGRPVQHVKTDGKKDKGKRTGTEKEEMLGNYRAYFSRRLNRIPAQFKEAIWQHKRYRYQKGSDKPMKEDDHCPDAKMLAQRRWMLGKSKSSLPPEPPPPRRSETVTGGLLDEQF
jgi:hypothetical protein